jgi:hypothetical protein
MAKHAPNPGLDPAKTYTVDQFLDIPHDLDDSEIELVLELIVSQNLQQDRNVKLHQISATGAIFLQIMEAAKRVAHLIRTRGMVVIVPGGPTVTVTYPLEPMVTQLFKPRRKP